MLILHPVLYLNTFGLLQTEDDEHSGISLFSPEIPGMQSRGGARLTSILQNWQIRNELTRREVKQGFGAGDYFVIGELSRVAVMTVGVNEDLSNLAGVLDFLKKSGERVVLLEEFAEDPALEVFSHLMDSEVGCEVISFEALKDALKQIAA